MASGEQAASSVDSATKRKNPQTEAHQIGIYRSSANFVNGVLGSGILSLPFALQETGFYTGFLLLILVCLISNYVSVLLINMASLKKVNSYEALAEKAWGRGLFYVTCIFSFLFPFGALVAYVTLIFETNKSILQQYFISNDAVKLGWYSYGVTIALFVLVMTPLSLLKDLAFLSFTSVLSVITFAVIIVITTVTAARLPPVVKEPHEISLTNFLGAIGSLSFSFVCTDSIFLIFNGLREKSQKRWNKVTFISFATLGIIYATFSLLCYFLVPNLSDYVLNSKVFNGKHEINACKILLNFMLTLTYPVVLHYSRLYLFSFVIPWTGPIEMLSTFNFYLTNTLVTLLIVITSVVLGLTIKGLKIIMSVTGLVASVTTGFVIPVIIIFRVVGFKKLFLNFKAAFHKDLSLKSRIARIANFVVPMFILTLGLVSFFIGVPMNIIGYVKSL